MSAQGPDLVGLAERTLALLEQGSFSATYKYALLIALLDLCLERTSHDGMPPSTLTTRALAEKTIELYWPHATPFDGGHVLRQGGGSKAQQAEILRAITDFRRVHDDAAGDQLHRARVRHAQDFERLARLVEWKLIEMPIPRLQVLGRVEERFLYTYAWDQRVKQGDVSAYQRGEPLCFDNRLVLLEGVGASLVRLNGVLRPLIQREWARMVAEMNALPQPRLEAFLFGATRSSLEPVRAPLLKLQAGRCFYCQERVASRCEVDHFIPWARHPDDNLGNLVAAHAACNQSKRDFLAAAPHVERWLEWTDRRADDLAALAREAGWEHDTPRTLGVARALYLRLPADARLWLARDTFEPAERESLHRALAA